MSRRYMATTGGLVFVLAASLFGQPTFQSAPYIPSVESAPPPMLIYSDQSPGAILHTLMWQGVARKEGRLSTLVTTPTDFVAALAQDHWSRMVVVADYAAPRSAYAPALSTYAQNHPDQAVTMFFCHDNGTHPAPGTAVLGTMAIVLWNHGFTTIGYAGGRDLRPEAEQGKPVILTGCRFPNFRYIQPKNPRVVVSLPVEQTRGWSMVEIVGGVIGVIQTSACYVGCGKTYFEKISSCDQEMALGSGQCDALYGSGGDSDPGDPAQYADCIEVVDKDHIGCVKSAAHTYKRCIDLCDSYQGTGTEAGG